MGGSWIASASGGIDGVEAWLVVGNGAVAPLLLEKRGSCNSLGGLLVP